jgi:mycofactocin system transcriptional regulator
VAPRAKKKGPGNFAVVTVVQASPGRPQVTSHAQIESAAFALFATNGFDATTMDDIATALRVGRRTLFRYYRSKNDIPWGQFDASLANFRELLEAKPIDVPLHLAVQEAVVEFNHLDEAAIPQHRRRMELLLTTPALQAHSAIRHAQWRQVITDYVARRLSLAPTDLLPRVVGHICLALALSAYEQWMDDPSLVLDDLLTIALTQLRAYLAGGRESA